MSKTKKDLGAVIRAAYDPSVTQDILSLVGLDVPLTEIMKWNDEQIQLVDEWVGASHFRASDNHVKVPPMPKFLRAALKGDG